MGSRPLRFAFALLTLAPCGALAGPRVLALEPTRPPAEDATSALVALAPPPTNVDLSVVTGPPPAAEELPAAVKRAGAAGAVWIWRRGDRYELRYFRLEPAELFESTVTVPHGTDSTALSDALWLRLQFLRGAPTGTGRSFPPELPVPEPASPEVEAFTHAPTSPLWPAGDDPPIPLPPAPLPPPPPRSGVVEVTVEALPGAQVPTGLYSSTVEQGQASRRREAPTPPPAPRERAAPPEPAGPRRGVVLFNATLPAPRSMGFAAGLDGIIAGTVTWAGRLRVQPFNQPWDDLKTSGPHPRLAITRLDATVGLRAALEPLEIRPFIGPTVATVVPLGSGSSGTEAEPGLVLGTQLAWDVGGPCVMAEIQFTASPGSLGANVNGKRVVLADTLRLTTGLGLGIPF